MTLEIQASGGNPRFSRYLIAKDTGEVYDGTGFNKDHKKAVLYVHDQELAQTFRSLEQTLFDHLPKREFKVALNIIVHSDHSWRVITGGIPPNNIGSRAR